jgi:hypothetical protein
MKLVDILLLPCESFNAEIPMKTNVPVCYQSGDLFHVPIPLIAQELLLLLVWF